MADEKVGRRSALKLGGMAAVGAVGAGVGASLAPSSASAAGFGFTPITPYRALDSRAYVDGRITAIAGVDWDVWRDEFGNPRIPSTVAAVSFNLTVTQTSSVGWLVLFPADEDYPGVSSINWSTAGTNLANGGTVKLGNSTASGPGSVTVGCGEGSTYYIIDVTGYYS